MANRLANATSPYLLQHAQNPVDWWEWGPEAFAEAKRRDTPILLSVGYAACHWCHVMAHESFEDEATARLLNEHFVSVKVDREERPDVDGIYMEATQAMTGQGGWPMTCFLTPSGRPFFCGTYFPPVPARGMPAFTQVAQAISHAWRDRRDEVTSVGEDVARRLGSAVELPAAEAADIAASAVRRLAATYDTVNHGFGGAPKFPPSMVCDFLLRYAARTGDREALTMATATLEAMARGGIFDQLAGGFARYSVDARWAVPHFEKMLYDNALLLRAYTRWFARTGTPLAERVARQTADFLLRDLRTPEGGFASALDADSEGVEGKFYVWTPGEVRAAVEANDATVALDLFAVGEKGNFEGDASTLRLAAEPEDGLAFERIRGRLWAARENRVHPHRDDKVVASWNGLAIGALAEAGVVLEEHRYVDGAAAAADILARVHWGDDGRLRRVSRDGVAGAPPGMLDDYAAVGTGLLALFGATGDARWFGLVRELAGVVTDHFPDGAAGYFDSPDDSEALFKRPQDPTDNATPSGQALAADLFVQLAALTGEPGYGDQAAALIGRLEGIAERAPRFAGHLLSVREASAWGPPEVAVVGPADDARGALLHVAFRGYGRGAAVAVGTGQGTDVPLLLGKTPVDGRATAYVCRNFVCRRPVTEPADLTTLVADG